MTKLVKAKFITIEGSDGAGKSTILKEISKILNDNNINFVETREPGGTAIGEKIRKILLDNNNKELHPESELLLIFADRAQHLHTKILPNLQKNNWVISDRFVDSSFAYQGGGREINSNKIQILANWLLNNFKPDLTLFLDLDPKIGLQRVKQENEFDRFEEEKIKFFNKVRKVFLERANKFNHIKTIDASQNIEQVKNQVIKEISKLIK